MSARRFLTAREQAAMAAPWRAVVRSDEVMRRTAAPERHPDLEESLRLHGVVHTTGGRRLPNRHLAVADRRAQETRLLDPRGWRRHPSFTPSGLAVEGARAYAGLVGLDDPHVHDYGGVEQTPRTVRTVGRLYDAMPAHDPAAVRHFDAMRRDVADQYDFMTNRLGVRTEVVDHDPYPDVHEMVADVNGRRRLKVLGTRATGGHPHFSDDENDMFRAVHDFFGHAATGRSFDRHGEQAAYLAHSRMFSPEARPAMTTETKGQNSSLILNGHFAPQKVGILPAEHWDDRALRMARRLLAAGAELRWERDSSGDWILVTRNPDGNPVAVRTERAPSVRTSRRTAMPLPEQAHDTDPGQDWADEPRSTSRTFNGPWFHASPHELAEGTVIRPRGDESPYGDKYDTTGTTGRQDWVWMETEPGGIHHWAQQGQAPNIYLVEPHDGPYPWNNTGMEGWVANGATVVNKISDNGRLPKGFVPQWVAEQRAKNARRTLNRPSDITSSRTAMPEAVGGGRPLPGYEQHMREVYDRYPPDSPDLPDSLRPHLMLPVDAAHHYREYDRPDDENTQMLKGVIADQGIRQPLKISTDGTHALMIEGNHRINVARQLGMTHVPVQVFLEKPGKVMTNSEGSRPVPLEPVLAGWIDRNRHTLRSFWD